MSVVGPRPMILAEYDQIQARDRYGANDTRPGLTGWAQVNGRDGVTVEEKARLDGWFVSLPNSGLFFFSLLACFNYLVNYPKHRSKGFEIIVAYGNLAISYSVGKLNF